MRRGNDGEVRRDEKGNLTSVNLGSDFTAEHEFGTEGIERRFGLDKTAAPGVPRRTMTRIPRVLFFDHEHNGIGVRAYEYLTESGDLRFNEHALSELKRWGSDPWESQGAWSGDDFGVVFPKTPQGKADAQRLWDAFQRKDIAFLFGNTFGNPFARAGLNLVIVSEMDPGQVAYLAERDADNDALMAAAEATGIRARLDTFTRRGTREYSGNRGPGGYFALSPRWANEEKTDVVFWLNPTMQDRYEAGWYTVGELDAWLRGEGPVLKDRVLK